MSSSVQQAQHKSPLIPSLFKTIRNGYTLGMLSKDISAGITVGVVAIPLALAFAIASGLTPERGLYTSIVAGFFMAFSSASRFPVSGPTGAFVVIIYSIVSRHGYEGLVLTTLMAGILLIIFGFLRLGVLVKYIPYPVTTGFTAGIALLIFSSQMKDFFGLPLVDTPPEFFDKWGAYAQNAMDFSPATFGVSLFTLAVILLIRRTVPKIPAPVVAVFLATLAVWLFGLPTETIGSRFGSLPTGFPEFTMPYGVTFERIRELFPDALTIALLAGIESLLEFGDRAAVEAVVTATGLGCIADSEKFLDSLIANEERMLNPTPFIQSTFNTVGAQIALLRGLHCYNTTYANRWTSFENALTDAALRIGAGLSRAVLVGAFDETTPSAGIILQRLGVAQQGGWGESSVFFVLTAEAFDTSVAAITGIRFPDGTAIGESAGSEFPDGESAGTGRIQSREDAGTRTSAGDNAGSEIPAGGSPGRGPAAGNGEEPGNAMHSGECRTVRASMSGVTPHFTAIAEVFRRVVAGEAGNTGKAGNIGNAGSIEDTGNIGNAGNAEQRIVLYNDFPGSTVSAIELTCM